MFFPWRYNIDHAAAALLKQHGWKPPCLDGLPTAGQIVDDYLAPLAMLPTLVGQILLSHTVREISREGLDKVKTAGREQAPFLLSVDTPDGEVQICAQAVIDASGTWSHPNPLGANGLAARGEREAAANISYGMPDDLRAKRERYAGKRVLVVGAGHSAAGNLTALADLAQRDPSTAIVWAVRGGSLARLFGGSSNDQLPARGELGFMLKALRKAGQLELRLNFRVAKVRRTGERLTVIGDSGANVATPVLEGIDEIIGSTGGLSDLSLTRELRVRLDPWLESTDALAPLIDPNMHSCGTVPPHGHRELAHPETDYYAVGAKSCGRARNFLMATGYEQVRSIVAALAGDMAAADDLRLELPETGVCSTRRITDADTEQVKAEPGCCGGNAPFERGACCVADAVVKDAGGEGCGWRQPATSPKNAHLAAADMARLQMPADRGQTATIAILTITQVLSWGSIYYAFAILSDQIQRDLGLGAGIVHGGFSWSLLVAGQCATPAGMMLDRFGGRAIMGGGSLIAALGLALLGGYHLTMGYLLAWSVIGLSMGMTLYEAAFATINREYPSTPRRSISILTLFGGLASTVLWPLTLKLGALLGWRDTYAAYACVQLLVCAPLHAMLPRPGACTPIFRSSKRSHTLGEALRQPVLWWLAAAFAANSLVFSALSVHLIPLLHRMGHTVGAVVGIAALIGPMQVVGRISEMMFARRVSPRVVGAMTFAIVPLEIAIAIWAGSHTWAAVAFRLLYGLSNGIITIVRGTLRQALFGAKNYGAISGAMAGPSLVLKAAGPLVLAAIMTVVPPASAVFSILLA